MALNDVSIKFRKSEFVSVLGPSGCGKTTMLNIIGGLDRYSEGDLSIKNISTKNYKSRDWDTYRNHSIGFVFQSYNLIPHQTVLQNVELALTISGVSAKQRKALATEALEKVGLKEQCNKKPNQMSGGQMQRVAIARALVNNPEIVLADEPTGALDSESSVQIMEILKEIAKDRLVVMVTHNPELAEKYSTRIVKLFDGKIVDDSNPYIEDISEDNIDDKVTNSKKAKKSSMSFGTAISLSLKNLFTKKARTILTSFAGSIGIIGISLILSMQNGVEAYITRVEEDTLSSYPITIEDTNMDFSETITAMMGEKDIKHDTDDKTIYSNDIMTKMFTGTVNGMKANDLESYKKHIDKNKKKLDEYTTDIKYSYQTELNVYNKNGQIIKPETLFSQMPGSNRSNTTSGSSSNGGASRMSNMNVWTELLDNPELLKKQYEVYGSMPKKYNEIVLMVDKNNEISDYTLYLLGLKDFNEVLEIIKKAQTGEKIEEPKQTTYSFDEIIGTEFKMLLNSDYFEKNSNGTYTDKRDSQLYIDKKLKTATKLKIVGILKPSEDNNSSSNYGKIGYRKDLMTTLINKVNNSQIVKDQQAKPDVDIFTGMPFVDPTELKLESLLQFAKGLGNDKYNEILTYIQTLKAQNVPEEEIVKKLAGTMQLPSLEGNLSSMGVSDLSKPSNINIFPKDFESKDKINEFIDKYNKSKSKEDKIEYTDYVGLLMSSVTTIINAISYILIAFVSISLVVSSIMIGIITYISVLERTKEIGILRAMGASKRDVSNVFNAETLIIGFASGIFGIAITLLLLIPINAIIKSLTDIGGLAVLPLGGAIALIVISMVLTVIAGLIPSRLAAKKDPVISLRTE